MTDLTDKIQRCGQHTCDCSTCSISTKEAQQAIDVVKQACIDAINDARKEHHRNMFKSGEVVSLFDMAIGAIRNVK